MTNDMIQYLERELEKQAATIRDLQQGLQDLEERVARLAAASDPATPRERLANDVLYLAKEQLDRLKP